MAKLRVHELARELGVSSKEIIDRLGDLGVEVKSHASTLDADAVGKVRAALNGPRNSARRAGSASTQPPAGASGSDGAAPGRRPAQSQPAAAHAPRQAQSQPAGAHAPRPASQSGPAASARVPAPVPAGPATSTGSGSSDSPAPAQRSQGGQGQVGQGGRPGM